MSNTIAMKKFGLFGLGVLCCVGCLSVVACRRAKDVTFSVLASDEHNGQVSDYYQVIIDEKAYRQFENLLSVSLPAVDFSSSQVVAVFDTLRPHPSYRIGIAKITEEDNYVNVKVKREYEPRQGGYSQAYVLARMPRIQKDVHFETLPFIGEPFEATYIPEEGVSPCLNRVQAVAGWETLYFKFEDGGVLWLEHRGMELNCARTLVETDVRIEAERLYIKENECLGPDSVMATCVCAKNVGYRSEGLCPEGDSLQVEFVFSTFERGQRARSFTIPSSGSGEVTIGKLLWP